MRWPRRWRGDDLVPQHLSNWIGAAKEGRFTLLADTMPRFGPVVVESAKVIKAGHEPRAVFIDLVIGVIKCGCRGAPIRESSKESYARFGARTHEWRHVDPTRPVQVLMATKPVNFRKGMDGLVALAEE